MSVLDRLNSKLGKPSNPIAAIIDQPKHTAGGKPAASSDVPLEDDDLPEEPAADVYTKPEDEIKSELNINSPEDRPIDISPDKKIDFGKQSDKLIAIADRVQCFVFGLIADVEDIDEFKFKEWEKDEFMLFLPDIAAEHGWSVNNELGLGLALLLALLTRGRDAWRQRKANKAKEEQEKATKVEMHVAK